MWVLIAALEASSDCEYGGHVPGHARLELRHLPGIQIPEGGGTLSHAVVTLAGFGGQEATVPTTPNAPVTAIMLLAALVQAIHGRTRA
jgi:hypothetical protein